jgi:tRNA/tmRNA/rRNA uracil-C5-methylase (TrmA/RlmC/RlmD family)
VFCNSFIPSGTIGIVTSSFVERVLGVDVVREAVQDAEYNAQLNGR